MKDTPSPQRGLKSFGVYHANAVSVMEDNTPKISTNTKVCRKYSTSRRNYASSKP